jgi:hypothetical protein
MTPSSLAHARLNLPLHPTIHTPRAQVLFHLQTRRPAVLPPLCQLFGLPPDGERPMQEGRFPDWRLLEVGPGCLLGWLYGRVWGFYVSSIFSVCFLLLCFLQLKT